MHYTSPCSGSRPHECGAPGGPSFSAEKVLCVLSFKKRLSKPPWGFPCDAANTASPLRAAQGTCTSVAILHAHPLPTPTRFPLCAFPVLWDERKITSESQHCRRASNGTQCRVGLMHLFDQMIRFLFHYYLIVMRSRTSGALIFRELQK